MVLVSRFQVLKVLITVVLSDTEELRFPGAARHTQRAYRTQWRLFKEWTLQQGLVRLPASPDTVARFLYDRHSRGASLSTIRASTAAIAAVHRLCDFPLPSQHAQIVRSTLKQLSHSYTLPISSVQPLTDRDVNAIQSTALTRRIGRGGFREKRSRASRRGRVDIALVRLLKDASLRRTEAATLAWGDVITLPKGQGLIRVPCSYAAGKSEKRIPVSHETMRALRAIRSKAATPDTPVFGLSESQVYRRVKAAASAAGLGDGFGGDSGRAGARITIQSRQSRVVHSVRIAGVHKAAASIPGNAGNEDPGRIEETRVPPDAQMPTESAWTTIGNVCGAHLRKEFRFDTHTRTWYAWRDGTHWVEIRDRTIITDVLHNDRLRIAADLGDQGREDLRNELADASKWRRETSGNSSEWWAALRKSLTEPKPSPPLHQIATPAGVANIRTGKIEPHDPFSHDTVALTNGNYRPQDIEILKGILWDRLQHNLDADDFDQLIALLGVAVARRSVDYSSILWFVGASGSGKSATASLIQAAFGGVAMGASADLLSRRPRTEIDAELTQLLDVDPVVLCISEVERVSLPRMLSLTGGDTVGARRPHGTMRKGSLKGMIVATSVEAPSMSVDSGIRRRIAVVPFPTKLSESVEPNRAFSQEELDAVVTLSIEAAREVGHGGWIPPLGNVEAKRAFLAEADPVSAWLEGLPDSWHGHTFKQVLDSCSADLQERISSTALGRAITASERWTRVENPKTRRKHLALVGKRLSLS